MCAYVCDARYLTICVHSELGHTLCAWCHIYSDQGVHLAIPVDVWGNSTAGSCNATGLSVVGDDAVVKTCKVRRANIYPCSLLRARLSLSSVCSQSDNEWLACPILGGGAAIIAVGTACIPFHDDFRTLEFLADYLGAVFEKQSKIDVNERTQRKVSGAQC